MGYLFVLPVGASLSRYDSFGEVFNNLVIFYGYVLCYSLTTAFLRTTVLKNVPTIYLPIITLLLVAILSTLPYLTAFFLTDTHHGRDDLSAYMLASPMILNWMDRSIHRAVLPVRDRVDRPGRRGQHQVVLRPMAAVHAVPAGGKRGDWGGGRTCTTETRRSRRRNTGSVRSEKYEMRSAKCLSRFTLHISHCSLLTLLPFPLRALRVSVVHSVLLS